MKLRIAIFVLFALLAASASWAEPSSIAVVDLSRAIRSTKHGMASLETLKKEFDQQKETLEKKGAQFNKLVEEYEGKKLMLTDDAKSKKEKELQQLYKDLQRMKSDLDESVTARDAEMTKKILTGVNGIVKEMAVKDGYLLVLEAGNTSGMEQLGVLYFSPQIDITDKVIALYDAQYKPQ